MDLLETVREEALLLDRTEFCQRHLGYWLLGRFPEESPDEWSFTTDIRRLDEIGRRPTMPSLGERLKRTLPVLWRVEKSDRNDWKRRISVGRATNNDIVIRHESVSKLHAHLHFGSLLQLTARNPSEFVLEDVGSSNGTLLNGERVAAGTPMPLRSGDRLAFGAISCELFNSEDLHHVLRTRVFD